MNITNDKPEKIKDPRKVEQGKRLAAISKEAKERTKQEREASTSIEILSEPCDESNVCLRLLGLAGVGVAAYLIFKYDPTKYFISPQPTTESKVVVKEEKKMNMLESFD